MRRILSGLIFIFVLGLVAGNGAMAQVTSQRMEHAASEPQNWIVYGGGFDNQR